MKRAILAVLAFAGLTGCAPIIVFDAEPHRTDCYLDHACLPSVWEWEYGSP